MLRSRIATLFGVAAILAVVALPASADEIESKVQVCSACHGQSGAPTGPTIPIIWGQQQNYLYKELHDFHSDDRNNAIMSPLVHSIALPDLRQIADYVAAKSWPAEPGTNAAAAPPEAITGKIQMCKACHQPNFEGGAPAPRLAGLSYEYLVAQMNAFADGERTNNLDMPGFMKALTESERDAMAHYLSGL